jgi:single-strand DNA-binding protein
MNNLNSVLLEGELLKDAILRKLKSGPVCTFTIVSNRFSRKDGALEKYVSFFEVEVWGKAAEIAEKQGTEGRGVRVVGRLKQERWWDVQGKEKSRISIVAEHLEFRPDLKEGKKNAV